MSTLWTPDGERPVSRTPEEPSPAASAEAPDSSAPDSAEEMLRRTAASIGVDLDSLSDEERRELQAELTQMMEVRRQVAATPASEMLANHMMRIFDLAVIYLETTPPSFAEAATVIEAFRAMLDGVGERLGEHHGVLTDALSQIQMLFVQLKDSAAGDS